MSRPIPIPLQVAIPTAFCAHTLSSSPSPSPKSASTGLSGSPSASPGVYIPVHRRIVAPSPSRSPSRTASEPRSPSRHTVTSPHLPPRVYAPATLLRLSCSPLAAQLATAPAMRAVGAVLGARRPQRSPVTSREKNASTGMEASWRPRSRCSNPGARGRRCMSTTTGC
ncbi:hypothetical protein B0H13DRAFT_631146 [Mycena leptocephala]|nr:hypothetical protein B0H13DRAFT_631146 [Mycena leptocephala]